MKCADDVFAGKMATVKWWMEKTADMPSAKELSALLEHPNALEILVVIFSEFPLDLLENPKYFACKCAVHGRFDVFEWFKLKLTRMPVILDTEIIYHALKHSQLGFVSSYLERFGRKNGKIHFSSGDHRKFIEAAVSSMNSQTVTYAMESWKILDLSNQARLQEVFLHHFDGSSGHQQFFNWLRSKKMYVKTKSIWDHDIKKTFTPNNRQFVFTPSALRFLANFDIKVDFSVIEMHFDVLSKMTLKYLFENHLTVHLALTYAAVHSNSLNAISYVLENEPLRSVGPISQRLLDFVVEGNVNILEYLFTKHPQYFGRRHLAMIPLSSLEDLPMIAESVNGLKWLYEKDLISPDETYVESILLSKKPLEFLQWLVDIKCPVPEEDFLPNFLDCEWYGDFVKEKYVKLFEANTADSIHLAAI